MSEWIKCSDRLPADGQHVIFYSSVIRLCFCGIFVKKIANQAPPYDEENMFWENYESSVIEDVTHWMNLIPPPEVKDD